MPRASPIIRELVSGAAPKSRNKWQPRNHCARNTPRNPKAIPPEFAQFQPTPRGWLLHGQRRPMTRGKEFEMYEEIMMNEIEAEEAAQEAIAEVVAAVVER